MLLVIDLSLPLRYQARPLADGRIEVRGVPIFAETDATATRPRGFGCAWLASYTAKAAKRPGYEAPLHLHHTDTGKAESVGTWVPEGLRLRDVDGVPRWVLFATLRYRDRAAFEAAKAFPHRSVEISPDHPDEINSLALLAEEAPYHRFPNLVTFRAARGESFMTEPEKKDAPPAPAPAPAAKADEKPVEKHEAAPAAPSVEERLAKLEALVMKLIEAEQAEAAACSPAGMTASLPGTQPASLPAHPAVLHAAEAARLTGANVALEAKLAKLERFQAVETAIRDAVEQLPPDARDEVTVKALRATVEKFGASASAAFVAGHASRVGGGPVATGRLGAGSQASNDDPAVAAYAAEPERLRQAREGAAFFREWQSGGRSLPFESLADYLANQIGPAPKKGS